MAPGKAASLRLWDMRAARTRVLGPHRRALMTFVSSPQVLIRVEMPPATEHPKAPTPLHPLDGVLKIR